MKTEKNKPHKVDIAKENIPSNIKPLLTYDQVKQFLVYLEKNKDFDILQVEAVYYSLIELNFIPKGFY